MILKMIFLETRFFHLFKNGYNNSFENIHQIIKFDKLARLYIY